MLIDYYAILEIEETATIEEMKAAFRKQAIKWHPDRNLGKDTTEQMQRINEAYLMLKDIEAREKFDSEYQRFKAFKKKQNEQNQEQKQENSFNSSAKQNEQKTAYYDYTFNDEVLRNWMNNARRQSVELAKQTIKDFKGMVKVSVKEGLKASGNALIFQIVIGFIVMIILGLAKSCQ